MVHGVDDATGSQEEQCLKKSVYDQMKGGGGYSSAADGKHHIADLADGGIGQNPLQIALGHGAAGPVKGGDGTNKTDDCNDTRLNVLSKGNMRISR